MNRRHFFLVPLAPFVGAPMLASAPASDALDVYQERLDLLVADRAFNDLRQRMFGLLFDENGLLKLSGPNTVVAPVFKIYVGLFDSRASLLTYGMNDRQYEHFSKRASAARLTFTGTVLAFIKRQTTLYRQEIGDDQLAIDKAIYRRRARLIEVRK